MLVTFYGSTQEFLSTPSARRATTTSKPRAAAIFLFLSTPSARRATISSHWGSSTMEFLSTPSARRATRTPRPSKESSYISIHALREEGDDLHRQRARRGEISIHALREEGDGPRKQEAAAEADFYPRPPRGGRRGWTAIGGHQRHFYPRPPRGGRRACAIWSFPSTGFLSTPSARRATADLKCGNTQL